MGDSKQGSRPIGGLVAGIGNIKSMLLEQRFDDGVLQIEWDRPTSQLRVSDVGDDRYKNCGACSCFVL